MSYYFERTRDTVRLVQDPVKTPWWQQSWLLGVIVAVELILVALNIWGHDWLGLAGMLLALTAFAGLWSSFRRQRHDRSVERPGI